MTAEGLKDALTTKYGPLPGYAWAALGAGVIVFVARRSSSSAAGTASGPAFLTTPPTAAISGDGLGAGGGGSDGSTGSVIDPAISTGLPSIQPAPVDTTAATQASSSAPSNVASFSLGSTTPVAGVAAPLATSPVIDVGGSSGGSASDINVIPHNPNDTVLDIVGNRAVVQETTGNVGEIARGDVIAVPPAPQPLDFPHVGPHVTPHVTAKNTPPAITTRPHPAAPIVIATSPVTHTSTITSGQIHHPGAQLEI